MKKGFTLIELLVVVLIIGILASVALPQYTRAVKKSRVATMQPTLKAIMEAGQAYLLANSVPGGTRISGIPLDDLDVTIPGSTGRHYFDLKGDGNCEFSFEVFNKDNSKPIKTASRCEKSGLILGLTNTGMLFCAGSDSDTLCKEYGFTKASSLEASADFDTAITGSVYTL